MLVLAFTLSVGDRTQKLFGQLHKVDALGSQQSIAYAQVTWPCSPRGITRSQKMERSAESNRSLFAIRPAFADQPFGGVFFR